MQNSSIIKGGICLMLIGLATSEVTQAGLGVPKEEVSAEKSKGGVSSVKIKHPVAFDKNGVQCQKYISTMYWINKPGMLPRAVRKQYPWEDDDLIQRNWSSWLLNSFIEVKRSLPFGVYNSKVQLRSETAEIDFKANKSLFSKVTLHTHNRPRLIYALGDAPVICASEDASQDLVAVSTSRIQLFVHELGTAVSPDGNREHLSADILEGHADGSMKEFNIKFERPTPKACTSAYYKDFIRVKLPDTPERLEAYIKKCIKDGTKIDVSPGVEVIR